MKLADLHFCFEITHKNNCLHFLPKKKPLKDVKRKVKHFGSPEEKVSVDLNISSFIKFANQIFGRNPEAVWEIL